MPKFMLARQDEQDVAAYRALPELRAEADRDLARRSVAGVFSYVVLWLILYYATELEQANNALLEFLGFMLAAAGVGRLYLAWNFNKAYASGPLRWRLLFCLGTTLSAATWGGVSVIALNYDGLGATSVMVMLSAAGIAAGGIVSLAPAAWMGGIFVLFLLLPIVPFAFASGTAPERGVALLFLTFFILMFVMWRRLHLEYWRALAGRAELVHAKEVAEAATLAKGQFIASVSHELRTPLTAIIGALGLIESESPGDIPEQSMKLISMAYQNGKRLSVLINDILDFEKLEADRMEFRYKQFELGPFLERALDLNNPYAESYKVDLAIEQPIPDVELVADEQRLMQVMANLLSNASKHSPAGETVLISARASGDKVRVAVKDCGAGVPESFQKQIFGKFAQAESASTRKIRGTGLGLAISKSIIEKMGGDIGFESVPGAGATFYFDLPLAVSDDASRIS
jgi:signal transduction histidine kinase